MKVLLVIAIFYINYVTSHEKYAVKSYPKKVKPFGAGKILINSPKHMFKPHSPEEAVSKVRGHKKSVDEIRNGRRYTVFQVIGNSKAIRGVPDSPYFSVDQTIDQKPRVKKVLPDYVWSSLGRIKRSVPEEITTGTPDSKSETKQEPTTIKTTEKQTVQVKTEKAEEKQTIVMRAQTDPDESKKTDATTVKNKEIKSPTTTVSKLTNTIKPVTKNATSLRQGKKNKSKKKRKGSVAKLSEQTISGNGARTKNKLKQHLKVKNGTKSVKPLKLKSKSKKKKSKKSKSLRHAKSSKKSKKSSKKSQRVNTTKRDNSTVSKMLKGKTNKKV